MALQQHGKPLVEFTKTGIQASYATISEAKTAIKELKLRKKELSLRKREINSRMKAIRAEYSHEIRTRGSMVRGGGGIGRVARALQTAARDSRRAKLSSDLAPYEDEKRRVETLANAIDSVVLQIEIDILKISES
jgi:signal transduction histidine kinase